ncbi:putative tail terminator protein [Acinetobacter phage DMU1]|nr:putative tail terminator protein [Acinetobacter phage DMU1]
MKEREYIEEALRQAVIAALGDIPVTVGNIIDQLPTDISESVDIHYMPAGVSVATLGKNGEDHHEGLMQCDIKVKTGTGTARSGDIAHLLTGIFTAGHRVWYNTTEVVITKSAKEQSFDRSGWWVTPVSIYWYSRVKRGV